MNTYMHRVSMAAFLNLDIKSFHLSGQFRLAAPRSFSISSLVL